MDKLEILEEYLEKNEKYLLISRDKVLQNEVLNSKKDDLSLLNK